MQEQRACTPLLALSHRQHRQSGWWLSRLFFLNVLLITWNAERFKWLDFRIRPKRFPVPNGGEGEVDRWDSMKHRLRRPLFAASIPSAQHAVHFSYSPYWFGLFWQHFWASAELYGYAEPETSKISFRDLTENYCKTCWWRKISCGKGGGWWQVCRLAPWICVAHLECMLRFPSCDFCFHREGISGVFTQITHSISFVVFS